MILFIRMDSNITEPGSGEMGAKFVGSVGTHTVDEHLPFFIGSRKTVIFIDDEKTSTLFQGTVHPRKRSSIFGQK